MSSNSHPAATAHKDTRSKGGGGLHYKKAHHRRLPGNELVHPTDVLENYPSLLTHSFEEIGTAMRSTRSCRAMNINQTGPELLKEDSGETTNILHKLFGKVWKTETWPDL